MKIALLAPFEESVPPYKYGGTELIVSHLAESFVAYGHQVYLLATGDSKTQANLVPIFPRAIRQEQFADNLEIRNSLKYIGISRVVEQLFKIKPDIIHNHIGWRFLPFARFFSAPVVTTLHGPLDIFYQQFFYGQFAEMPYVSISNAQREPFLKLNYAATVYNGINLKDFTFNQNSDNYLAFLGRTSPEKGLKEAIQIAKKAGIKLKIAAKIDAVDLNYFNKEIKPLIDNKQIEYIGEIGAEERDNFLGKATALLAPIQWREPFGLFFVEAMACGTPVIATKMGSVPEVVKNGETGFVVENQVDNFVEAIKKIKLIDRKNCRQHVEKNFTVEKMAKNYLKVYKRVLKK